MSRDAVVLFTSFIANKMAPTARALKTPAAPVSKGTEDEKQDKNQSKVTSLGRSRKAVYRRTGEWNENKYTHTLGGLVFLVCLIVKTDYPAASTLVGSAPTVSKRTTTTGRVTRGHAAHGGTVVIHTSLDE